MLSIRKFSRLFSSSHHSHTISLHTIDVTFTYSGKGQSVEIKGKLIRTTKRHALVEVLKNGQLIKRWFTLAWMKEVEL